MAEYLIQGDTLTDIANAIRSKTGSTTSIKPSHMATVISSISSGSNIKTGEITLDSPSNVINAACGFMPSVLILCGPETITNEEIFACIYDSTKSSEQYKMYYHNTSSGSAKTYIESSGYPSSNDPYVWIIFGGLVGIKDTMHLNFAPGTWNYIAIE